MDSFWKEEYKKRSKRYEEYCNADIWNSKLDIEDRINLLKELDALSWRYRYSQETLAIERLMIEIIRM